MKLFVRFLKLFIPSDANLVEGLLILIAITGSLGVVLFASFGVHTWAAEAQGYPPINPVWNLLGNAILGMAGYIMYWVRTWGKGG